MHLPAYDPQRDIALRLLAEGWHADQTADPRKPASRWILRAPGRRHRLILARDYAGTFAELAGLSATDTPLGLPTWRVIVHTAGADTVLAAARATVDAPAPAIPADQRRYTARLLRAQGWTGTTGRLALLTRATTTFTAPDGNRAVVWTAPGRRRTGGWDVTGTGLRVAAHPSTPAVVLNAIATG